MYGPGDTPQSDEPQGWNPPDRRRWDNDPGWDSEQTSEQPLAGGRRPSTGRVGDYRPGDYRPGGYQAGGYQAGDYRPGGQRPGDYRPGGHGQGGHGQGGHRPGTHGVPPGGPRRPWWRTSSGYAAIGAFVAVTLAVLTGWILTDSDDDTVAVASTPNASVSLTPSAAPTSDAATPSPTPTPTPTQQTQAPAPAVTRTQAVVPIPTEKPPPAELPPPPPPPVPDTPDCVQHPGPDATTEQVRTALAAAGGQQYWKGVVPPAELKGALPTITIPAALMNAFAFTESSWRSTVIACDKGIGLMQVMPDTAAWMNQRFGRSYDPMDMNGNASLGAMYLEWLTMYFGLFYFGSFDLNVVEKVGEGGTSVRLRDVVIAAYNVGHEQVENTHGTETATDDTISIPNQWYVDRVNGYLTSCPCEVMP